MRKRKKKNKQIYKKIKAIRSILDSNYFHVAIKIKEKDEFDWRVYYNNLPEQIYYSEKNKPLLTSKKNTIDDIFKLKDKFEKEKQKELEQNLTEYINIACEVFRQMLNMKSKFSEMVTDLLLANLIISIINMLFIKDTICSLLQLIFTFLIVMIGFSKLFKIQKEIDEGQEKMKETFIRGKISKQGIYFIKRLEEGK